MPFTVVIQVKQDRSLLPGLVFTEAEQVMPDKTDEKDVRREAEPDCAAGRLMNAFWTEGER